jgi:hypothetical protein
MIPCVFSAPASFLCLPIESVFKYLKLTDFRKRSLDASVVVKGHTHLELTHKQRLLAQVSFFINNLSQRMLNRIFNERL